MYMSHMQFGNGSTLRTTFRRDYFISYASLILPGDNWYPVINAPVNVYERLVNV